MHYGEGRTESVKMEKQVLGRTNTEIHGELKSIYSEKCMSLVMVSIKRV